jgi:hypothetical protein
MTYISDVTEIEDKDLRILIKEGIECSIYYHNMMFSRYPTVDEMVSGITTQLDARSLAVCKGFYQE